MFKSERDFSFDEKVLAAVYEHTEVEGKNVWMPTIIDHFQGELSVNAVLSALIRLHESKIIGTKWGKVRDKKVKTICIFIRSGHGNLVYAKELYTMIQKVKISNN